MSDGQPVPGVSYISGVPCAIKAIERSTKPYDQDYEPTIPDESQLPKVKVLETHLAEMMNRVVEMAGQIEFYQLDTQVRQAEFNSLESRNRLLAAELKGIKAEISILKIELNRKNLTNPRNYISEKEER
jgi:hypothetical protein